MKERRRCLSSKLVTGEKWLAMSLETRFISNLILLMVDDMGCFHADPRLVKAYCTPIEVRITEEVVKTCIDEAVEKGIFKRYSSRENMQYLFWTEFYEMNTFRKDIKHRDYCFPIPPEEFMDCSEAKAEYEKRKKKENRKNE